MGGGTFMGGICVLINDTLGVADVNQLVECLSD